MRLISGDDRWLFLTPEIEREVPGLLAAVGQAREADEQQRIEALIHHGTHAGLVRVPARLPQAA